MRIKIEFRGINGVEHKLLNENNLNQYNGNTIVLLKLRLLQVVVFPEKKAKLFSFSFFTKVLLFCFRKNIVFSFYFVILCMLWSTIESR